jgi:hypothetical protein
MNKKDNFGFTIDLTDPTPLWKTPCKSLGGILLGAFGMITFGAAFGFVAVGYLTVLSAFGY